MKNLIPGGGGGSELYRARIWELRVQGRTMPLRLGDLYKPWNFPVPRLPSPVHVEPTQ